MAGVLKTKFYRFPDVSNILNSIFYVTLNLSEFTFFIFHIFIKTISISRNNVIREIQKLSPSNANEDESRLQSHALKTIRTAGTSVSVAPHSNRHSAYLCISFSGWNAAKIIQLKVDLEWHRRRDKRCGIATATVMNLLIVLNFQVH